MGLIHTKADFLNILNKSQDVIGLAHYKIDDSKVMKIVNYFFNLKRCKIKRGEERVNGYEIVSTNPSGLSLSVKSGKIEGLEGEALRSALKGLYGNDNDLIDTLMKF